LYKNHFLKTDIMKKSNFGMASLLFLGFLFLASCQKNSVAGPNLSITSPAVDDNFTGGQVISIKGETSDDVKLHALTIKITDDKTGAVLFTNAPTVHDMKSYSYNVTWTAKVSDWTDATVTVTSENQESVQTVKTVKIKIWL
jgi:hypothetical protein